MKKLFKLIPILIAPAIAAPFVASVSSCANAFGTAAYVYDPLSIDAYKAYLQLEKAPSLKSLVYGNTTFNNGNYVLIIGSNTNLETREFILNSSASSPRIDTIPAKGEHPEAQLNDSPLFQAARDYGTVHDYPGSSSEDSVAFATYIDICTKETTQALGNPYTPFDQYNQNDKEVVDGKHKAGDYHRTDQSAQNYRAFYDTAKVLFGSDKIGDNTSAPWAIFWKKGFPQKVISKSLSASGMKTQLEEIYIKK